MNNGPYWVGDVPTTDLVVVPSRGGEDVDLAPFNDVDVILYDPDGVPVPTAGFLAQLSTTGSVIIEWPGDSVLGAPGIYTLVLILLTEVGGRERADSITFVAQADDGWHTLESIRGTPEHPVWADAPEEDTTLYALMQSAKTQCIEYAPPFTGRPPTHYRQAQLIQSRNLWQSTKADDAGSLGADGYAVPVYSMDWVVKGLLRPKRGTPIAG
jgi:hypothetical protein